MSVCVCVCRVYDKQHGYGVLKVGVLVSLCICLCLWKDDKQHGYGMVCVCVCVCRVYDKQHGYGVLKVGVLVSLCICVCLWKDDKQHGYGMVRVCVCRVCVCVCGRTISSMAMVCWRLVCVSICVCVCLCMSLCVSIAPLLYWPQVSGHYTYYGEWESNARTGYGVLVRKNGRKEEGQWQRGRLVHVLRRKKLTVAYLKGQSMEGKVKQAHTLALQVGGEGGRSHGEVN